MKWNIIADSSCDLMALSDPAEGVGYETIPFVLSVGDTDFVDDGELDTAKLLLAMEACPTASHSACPSPVAWFEAFEKADQSIAITISSELSGSYNSALSAKNMMEEEHPEKRIHILDSRSTGPEPALIAEKINALIREGLDFDQVVAAAEQFAEQTHVLFTLSSFENLVKNGRVNRMVGFIAGKLGMRVIGVGSDEGKIVLKHKTFGASKAIPLLLQEMEAMGYTGGRVAISHCHNQSLAEAVIELLRERFHTVEATILATRGLCSYYAERNGLIIVF